MIRQRLLDIRENEFLKGLLGLSPIVALITVLYMIPVLLLLVYGFTATPDLTSELSLEHFARFLNWEALSSFAFADMTYVRLLFRSLLIAILVTVVTVLISYPITYYLGQHAPEKYKMLLVLLVIIPFWTSYLVRTYAWMPILSEGGFINSMLGTLGLPTVSLLYTQAGTIIGLVYVFAPFTILPMYASMDRLDPSLLEAARGLGASRWQLFKEVIFPLTLPGVAAGAIFVFVKTAAAYVTPTLLGGVDGMMFAQVIANQYQQAFNWSFGAALALILVVVVFATLWLANRSRVELSGTRSQEVGEEL